MKYCRNK